MKKLFTRLMHCICLYSPLDLALLTKQDKFLGEKVVHSVDALYMFI